MPRQLNQKKVIEIIKGLFPVGSVVSLEPGPLSERGISDTVITWNGADYFCEIKTLKTKIDPLQVLFLMRRAYPMLLNVKEESVIFYNRSNQPLPQPLHSLPEVLSRSSGRLYGCELKPIEYLFESYLRNYNVK